jgi:hypothetical protein
LRDQVQQLLPVKRLIENLKVVKYQKVITKKLYKEYKEFVIALNRRLPISCVALAKGRQKAGTIRAKKNGKKTFNQ